MAALRPGPPAPPPGRPADLTASAVGAPPGPRAAALPTGAHPPRPSVGRRLLRDAREVLGTVAIALGIAIVIKTFLIQPFYIPSQSMEDTLLVGDRVLVSKLEPGPFELDRGDVAVFVDPGGWLTTETPEPSLANRALTFVGLLPANSGEHLIKRVIGLPGEEIAVRDSHVYINGQPLDEPYINESTFSSSCPKETWEKGRALAADEYFVMGDNRNHSRDSRCFGPILREHIIGEALIRYWPPQNWGLLYKFRYPGNPFE
jgi:signal peptidase I